VPSTSVALTALASVAVKVSSLSSSASPWTLTVINRDVTPGAKVTPVVGTPA
jgi:hypothetical protein